MKKIIILTEKSWHQDLLKSLKTGFDDVDWILLNKKDDFSYEKLIEISPDKVFIPHWSYIIPSKIFETFECIVFHMTDLPYGRGGSPLQNLIVRGHTETKISALKVEGGLDTGPIYLKKSLSLLGTGQEIFLRSSYVVKEMIVEIIDNKLKPVAQEGEIVEFKRRKPKHGNLEDLNGTQEIYNYIRMLDCDGYPPAFIETKDFRFEFTRASLRSEEEIIADVRIIKK